jgi:hypothetical protein
VGHRDSKLSIYESPKSSPGLMRGVCCKGSASPGLDGSVCELQTADRSGVLPGRAICEEKRFEMIEL